MKYLENVFCIECKHHSDTYTVGEKRHDHYCFCTVKKETERACIYRKCKFFEREENVYMNEELQEGERRIIHYLEKSSFSQSYKDKIINFFKYAMSKNLSLEEIKTLDAETLYERIKGYTKQSESVCLTTIRRIQQILLDVPVVVDTAPSNISKELRKSVAKTAWDEEYKKEFMLFYRNVLVKKFKMCELKTLKPETVYDVVKNKTEHTEEWCLVVIKTIQEYLNTGVMKENTP